MRRWIILTLPLLAACTSQAERPPPGLTRSDAPAANTGLLRPDTGVDPGIRAPLPNRSPTTMPVIPPNPGIQAR